MILHRFVGSFFSNCFQWHARSYIFYRFLVPIPFNFVIWLNINTVKLPLQIKHKEMAKIDFFPAQSCGFFLVTHIQIPFFFAVPLLFSFMLQLQSRTSKNALVLHEFQLLTNLLLLYIYGWLLFHSCCWIWFFGKSICLVFCMSNFH